VPAPRVPRLLQLAFPAGMFAMLDGSQRIADDLPDEWPERPLWLCAVDITRGRRVVLGRGSNSADTSLRRAVMASCAIPWLYPPVRIGRMTLVDGGAVSSTNLDVAATAGCDLVVAVVPMAYDTAEAPRGLGRLVRRIPARSLAVEVAGARRRGATVLLLRPSAAEVGLHGLDSMRPYGLDDVASAAYESTAKALETPRFQRALDAIRTATGRTTSAGW